MNARGVEKVCVSSTAQAAQLASQEPFAAAIASSVCSQMFNLPILVKGIQDKISDLNITRFVILADEMDEPSGEDKTMIYFTIDHRQPGALCSALSVFKEAGINLSMLTSRPTGQTPWHYYFFVEMCGHHKDSRVKDALKALNAFASNVRILGSYPCVTPRSKEE